MTFHAKFFCTKRHTLFLIICYNYVLKNKRRSYLMKHTINSFLILLTTAMLLFSTILPPATPLPNPEYGASNSTQDTSSRGDSNH